MTAKTHIKHPNRAKKHDGSIDVAIGIEDAKDAVMHFANENETMLDQNRIEHSDGSVSDIFRHIATSELKK